MHPCCEHGHRVWRYQKNIRWASWRDREPWVHLHLQDFFCYQALDSTNRLHNKKETVTSGVDTPTLVSPKPEVDTPTIGLPKPGVDTPTLGSPKTGVDVPTLGSPKPGVDTPNLESPKPGVDTPTLGSPQPDGEKTSG